MRDGGLDGVVRRLRKLAAAQVARDLSDAQLLQRFRSQRDEAAFTILVHRHGSMVLSVCRRVLGHFHDAEDAFQATFLVLATRAGSIRKDSSLGSWLHGVAQRIARKAKARTAKRQARETPLTNLPHPEAVDKVAWQEVRAVLDEEMSRLPEKYRAPLVLCYLEGKTNEEAARELGCPKSSLAWRLGRARELLRQRLNRRGLALSAGALAVVVTEQAASAPVPASLAIAAVHAAVQLAGGQAAVAGLVSAKVLTLAQGSVPAMGLNKIKLAVVLAIAMAAGVGGVVTLQTPARVPTAVAEEPPKNQPDNAPTKTNPPRNDPHDDPVPEGAIARLGTMRFNHGGFLNALFFSPDGKAIISEGSGFVSRWDAASGRETTRFNTDRPDWDDQVTLTPDGKALIFLSQVFPRDRVWVWNLEQKRQIRSFVLAMRRSEIAVSRRNALSSDGKLGATNTAEAIQVFDLDTGRELHTLFRDAKDIRAVAFAGTDRLVTADSRDTIEIWNARTGKAVRQFKHGAPAHVLVASPDGRWLATLEHHTYAIDKFLDKDVVHVWDLATGVEKHRLAAPPKSWYMRLCFSPDGKRLLTSMANESLGELAVWDLDTGKRIRDLGRNYTTTAAFSPDGNRLAVGDIPFELWDVNSGKCLSDEDPVHARAAMVLLSPAGDRATTVGSHSISTWDATTGRRLHSAEMVFPYATLRSHSADGRYATTMAPDDENSKMIVWDVAARRRLHAIPVSSRYARVPSAFSSDSALFAFLPPGKEATVHILDVRSGAKVRSFKLSTVPWPGSLFFADKGKTLLVVANNVVGFDVASGKELFSWRMKPPPTNAFIGGQNPDDRVAWSAFTVSPDGIMAACVLSAGVGTNRIENRLVLCNARTGQVFRRWSDSGNRSHELEQLAFSPDGKMLASSDVDVVHLWEVATSREIRTLRGHRGEILSLGFSANGRRLASAARDGTALIRDLTGQVDGTVPNRPMTDAALAKYWNALAGDDPAPAHRANWALAFSPDRALPFLKDRLRPVKAVDPSRLKGLTADLEANDFAVRERATVALIELGDQADSALRGALEAKPGVEQRRRIEQILAKLETAIPRGDALRSLRAVQALEHCNTPQADDLLRKLAAGAVESRLTREAKASLDRLSTWRAATP